MRNCYLTLSLICICSVCFAQQQTNDISTKNPPNKEWNFNNLDGWEYGHQDDNPDNQCILENGYLRIFTRANSVDRKKVRTVERIYTTGRYTWRTHIPQMGIGDQCSVGSWIYHDDQHELDFEVGYGVAFSYVVTIIHIHKHMFLTIERNQCRIAVWTSIMKSTFMWQ